MMIRIRTFGMFVLLCAGCSGVDRAAGIAEPDPRSSASVPSAQSIGSMAPGTVELLSVGDESRRRRMADEYSKRAKELGLRVETLGRAPSSLGLDPQVWSAMMQSAAVKRSPELALILSAAKLTDERERVQRLRALPIQKSTSVIRGSSGPQLVSTYTYKGRALLRVYGASMTSLNGANVPQDQSGGFAPVGATPLRPTSFNVPLGTFVDELASVEDLENAVIELSAMELEMDQAAYSEEMDQQDYENWLGTLVRFTPPESVQSTQLRTIALASDSRRSACSAAIGREDLGSFTFQHATFARVEARAQSCRDQHVAAVMGFVGAAMGIAQSRVSASAAFASALISGSTTSALVAVAWVSGAAILVGGALYAGYVAYECRRNGRQAASWVPSTLEYRNRMQAVASREIRLRRHLQSV